LRRVIPGALFNLMKRSAWTVTIRSHPGPSLLALAVVYATLALGATAAIALITCGQRVPSPFGTASDTVGFFVSQRAAMRAGAFFQLGAATVLGIFSAATASRLASLGVRGAGAQIAFLGGVAASVFTALGALSGWVLGQDGLGVSIDVLHALHVWTFATGQVGHVASFGLLAAGVSVAGGQAGVLPRWVMAFGLALAAAAELSTLGLIIAPVLGVLTLVRLGELAWLVAVGALLPRFPRE
jgi:hypothetical protein